MVIFFEEYCMKETLEQSFRDLVVNTSLETDIQNRLLVAIEKLSSQEQILLLQLFQKYPEKIEAFWKISRKKFEYMKNGVGDLEKILQEEIELFS